MGNWKARRRFACCYDIVTAISIEIDGEEVDAECNNRLIMRGFDLFASDG